MRFYLPFLILTILGVSCLGLTGCSHFPPRLYRMDIQQGNDITPEMIAKLRRGMSEAQVREILGSPTVPHVLDTERWDYYFSYVPGMGGERIEKHFVVYFKNHHVVHFESEK